MDAGEVCKCCKC